MAKSKLDKILEVVVQMKDKMDNDMVTQKRFDEKHNEVLNHIDGFVKLHQTLDTELVSLRHKYERLDNRLKTVEEKVGVIPKN